MAGKLMDKLRKSVGREEIDELKTVVALLNREVEELKLQLNAVISQKTVSDADVVDEWFNGGKNV